MKAPSLDCVGAFIPIYGAQVRALLKRYGAAQLSAVKAEDYESLLLAAQAIGNEVGADG